MIARFIEDQILDLLQPQKVVVLLGPRRAGKTILLGQIKEKLVQSGHKVLYVQGDNLEVAEIMASRRTGVLQKLVAGYDVFILDEAQHISHIGESLKLMVDSLPELGIIVSGSSAFDLKNKIGEPLTGRVYFLHLYPLSILELNKTQDYLSHQQDLEDRLIYGMYPQVYLADSADKKRIELENLRDSFLLKDILSLDNIKDSLFILNLLRLLAFRIGHDISYSELAEKLNSNKKTVMRYLELLQKTYVLFSLPGFSRNLRSEYTRTPRYYFWDLGVRNVVIANFNPLYLRDDVGQLWENFVISERVKKQHYNQISCNWYFWRTYDQKEIDLIEESAGKLSGFECKWKPENVRVPQAFLQTYPQASFTTVHRENYLEFVT